MSNSSEKLKRYSDTQIGEIVQRRFDDERKRILTKPSLATFIFKWISRGFAVAMDGYGFPCNRTESRAAFIICTVCLPI